MDEHIEIDVDQLREALIDETGPAAFVGMPWAMADVVALEEADPEELVREAERRGWDLRRFEV
ncbi:hypothetical protein [[Collinsella] massiliensis]|uniref:Uncharacterized protein n=1 Tax=[Collinsella] massiliensis TaxID=1232426 RepID=A0A1Y3XHJ2_9ACTN|nr:hypothetical protein [[Collinsella] massiliensis]OUN85033.1 hypothetical protein B5G02_09410 [[Collinsella] massiliensis]